jgi:hypothetical protein
MLALVTCAFSQKVIYSKSFPGSVPAFVWISVEKSGSVIYKEAPDDDTPLKLGIEPSEASEIFDLAEKLDKFAKPLESGLKVANMGMKTFRWENGSEAREVKFNYSLDENARLLHDWFERITESERLFFELERTVRYDRLGVHSSLVLLEQAWDRKRLVAPKQYLPLLERVIKNEAYMHIARERASRIAEMIRAPKPSAE